MTFLADNRRPIFILIAVIALLMFIILGFSTAFSGNEGQFYAGDPTPPPRPVLNENPISIAFSDLDADPFALRDQYIRVTGRFFPQTPVACVPHKGPRPRWGLIADNLQMDMVGLRDLSTFVPEGVELTIDGIWRLYEGPIGCGKEPAKGSLWHLEARQVHQPNPLVFDNFEFPTAFARVGEGTEAPVTVEEPPTATPTMELMPSETPTATPDVTSTPTISTTTATATPTPTNTPRVIISPTPLDGNNNGGGSTPPGGGGGNPGTPGTPDPNATVDPTNPGGVPTAPPGTVVPATLPATVPPGGYGGDGGYGN